MYLDMCIFWIILFYYGEADSRPYLLVLFIVILKQQIPFLNCLTFSTIFAENY
jgi:hypothetical protein